MKSLFPEAIRGVEVGVGSGRFAAPLGVRIGVEPSIRMSELAKKRGIKVVGGIAEHLPIRDSALEYVLMVTTICFVDDLNEAFAEAHRVLSDGGYLIIGFVDRNSPIGQEYLRMKDSSVFYKNATFYSVEEVVETMEQTGFHDFDFRQTIFKNLADITEREHVSIGYGDGSFVVIRAQKKLSPGC
ncbi:MAG: class I SAM-dependent methyltransferase [Desulfomonilia bacterium]